MKAIKDYLSRCSVYGIFLPSILFVLQFFEKYVGKGQDLRQRIVLNFLKKQFSDIIARYKDHKVENESIPSDAPIWFCWYQGEDSMPEIVKACLRSIRKHAGSHPLMILDFNNIGNYVDFPKHIAERLNNHTFNLVYLSDFLRNYLLSRYGGIWLDTTIYALNPINMPALPFWTVKRRCTYKRYVSRQRWTGFAMAGVKGNPLNTFVRDVLSEYHKKYPVLIDHFLIDFTIALGYEEIPCIRDMVDNVPLNNEDLYYFQSNIYEDYDAESAKVIKKTHMIQKVHHRFKGCDNKNSYYYHIVNNEI